MPESHERKAKRILSRSWQELSEIWIGHVPHVSLPGDPPRDPLSALQELDRHLTTIPSSQVEEVFDDIPGLRSGLLHESIYSLHKAAHVLGSSLVHIAYGMCTWSLSSAYHSAFFAMKSVMGMLGVVAMQSHNGRHFLVDVWGSPQKRRKGQSGPTIILANTDRTEQRHMWAYFQRTLEVTEDSELFCDPQIEHALLQCEFTDFARQRNALHYTTNAWPLNDLHSCVTRYKFGVRQSPYLDFQRIDFSILLAYGMVSMGRAMLSQLAQSSRVLDAELTLIDNWLSEPFNKRYQDSLA